MIEEKYPEHDILGEEFGFNSSGSKWKWILDPIDGTKEFIAGKNEYTLNAALVINQIPVLGLVGVPKLDRLFFSYGKNNSYLLENEKIIKINCSKKTPKNKVIAVSSLSKPSEIVLKKLILA